MQTILDTLTANPTITIGAIVIVVIAVVTYMGIDKH